MCGIFGILSINKRPPFDLERIARDATRRLSHRGPDADGYWSGPGIWLGHTRLSIIDLQGSIQPMADRSGRYIIIFNGEIYNYVELRKELEDRHGCRFQTVGDTEVILQSFIVNGKACLSTLNGMFAFAIWDREKKELFAARDRLGVKPFFYTHRPDGLFSFASEMQAFKALPLQHSINPDALSDYFRTGFVHSPGTIFKEVLELRPGHACFFNENGLRIERWWAPPGPFSEAMKDDADESTLAEELEALILDAVRIRLRSDVPLGAFLSGGLDSSVVVAAMARSPRPRSTPSRWGSRRKASTKPRTPKRSRRTWARTITNPRWTSPQRTCSSTWPGTTDSPSGIHPRYRPGGFPNRPGGM